MTFDPKSVIAPFRAALYDFDGANLAASLRVFAEASIKLAHPLGEMDVSGLAGVYAGLSKAWPDFERRESIVISGEDQDGAVWIGCCGYYCGTFEEDWLDIPATGHLVHMRFHEFFRIEGEQVVEMQAVWDLPEVMMQAGVWPMVPSLGREIHVPGPASGDGLGPHGSGSQVALVEEMLSFLSKHPKGGGPEVMEMERFWHPKMNWYGPSGIGTSRGIKGFRNNHQIPFLAAMPDRGQNRYGTSVHFFGEGDFVAVTGWPNMRQTISAGGWLGIAPSKQDVVLRSLDFWRVENGLIRENWVLLDLLDLYRQIGVDVMGRMKEMRRPR